MTLELPTLRLIAAAVAVPVLALALYRRIGRIASFQKSELARRTPFATARVATAGASAVLLVIIGLAAAAGASVRAVYALLFIEAACVLVYLVLTGAAGFLEAKTGRDRDDRA
jgi:hypothetical protein